MAKYKIEEGILLNCTVEESDHGTISVPYGVIAIASNAFFCPIPITKILLPTTLRHIEKEAFRGVRWLEEIHIPAGVDYIGPRAFFHTTVKVVYYGSMQNWDDAWDVCDYVPAKFLRHEEFVYLPREDKSRAYAQYVSAKSEYDKGQFKTALPLFERAAAEGITEARVMLAYMYCFGEGVDQNFAAAEEHMIASPRVFSLDIRSLYVNAELTFRKGKDPKLAIVGYQLIIDDLRILLDLYAKHEEEAPLSIKKTFVRCHLCVGKCFERLREYDTAIEWYTAAYRAVFYGLEEKEDGKKILALTKELREYYEEQENALRNEK